MSKKKVEIKTDIKKEMEDRVLDIINNQLSSEQIEKSLNVIFSDVFALSVAMQTLVKLLFDKNVFTQEEFEAEQQIIAKQVTDQMKALKEQEEQQQAEAQKQA